MEGVVDLRGAWGLLARNLEDSKQRIMIHMLAPGRGEKEGQIAADGMVIIITLDHLTRYGSEHRRAKR